jgi:hypothetical protein
LRGCLARVPEANRSNSHRIGFAQVLTLGYGKLVEQGAIKS